MGVMKQRLNAVQEVLDEEIPPHWDIDTTQLAAEILDALDALRPPRTGEIIFDHAFEGADLRSCTACSAPAGDHQYSGGV